jgi:ATP-dependent Lon protease
MYRIQTKGYDKKQKIIISNNYLLPKIQEQIKFAPNDIQITEEALNYIIDNNCEKESGVRNLKRCLEIIYTKLNLYRLMKPGSSLFGEEMLSNVTFPFKVDNKIVHKLIKKNEDETYLSNLYI